LKKCYGLSPESYYGKILQQLVADGLLEQKAGYLCLSEKGRVFANRVMAELV
jgi:coproporphyrinogen III oxidase-like Fe-S oxidoreductase